MTVSGWLPLTELLWLPFALACGPPQTLQGPSPRSFIGDEFNMFVTLFVTGLVKVAIVAEGEDDPKGTGRTSIKVNGIERSPMLRGHNIVILDSDRNFIMAANFDTADSSKGEGVKMAKFLQQLPQERIVLIGTQGTTGK